MDSREVGTTKPIGGHSIWPSAVAAFAVTLESEPWMVEAACIGHAKLFFGGDGKAATKAKGICARCPVLEDCRRWNDHVEGGGVGSRGGGGLHGVFGGESPQERVARRRAGGGRGSLEAPFSHTS
jgi:hypothetical protein